MAATIPLLTVAIKREDDVLLVRRRGREISKFLGFSNGDITRITTAISEIARNAYEYGGGGKATFAIETQPLNCQDLVIRVIDEGIGIGNVEAVLAPEFRSRTGLGVGIRGSRSLMDRFAISSTNGHGTTVMMAKSLPWAATRFHASDAARLTDQLAKATDDSPLGELQLQNQSLLNTLQELTERQAEVQRLSGLAEEARKLADAARERAEEAQRIAERSLVVRERFMALTTHELRTPLGAIVGYLELLDMEMSDAFTEKQKGYLERVRRASKHMLGLTNDFLDMAQGDAGRLRVAREVNPVSHVMSEAASLLAPQAAVRGVTIGLAATTENLTYLGDVARVRQILVNLIGNAVSFTPSGGDVRVTAERIAEPPSKSALTGEGPWCVIRVEDSGPGIPDDKLASVFEAFVQLSSEGQASRKGSGLGLTVSRQLALLMGGDLIAGSTDAGAVFSLWLEAADRRTIL